jgi:chemotaxis protein methyltransferase CheR
VLHGEEPYSIAIWLLENWPMVDQYEIEIVGSDIDTGSLEKARSGVFWKAGADAASPYLVDKYFVPAGSRHGKFSTTCAIRVRFSQVNIVEPAETRPYGQFDVIFCRNVLIYFDDASRRVAAENLYENLVPGGYICLGPPESMSRITPLFDVRRYAGRDRLSENGGQCAWLTRRRSA